MRHPRQVLTRAQIIDAVWGYDFGTTSNSLEVYMGYLRRKTEASGLPRLLQTVRGVGYVLPAQLMGRLHSLAAGVSLRARLTLIAALAVAIAVAGIAVVAYVAVEQAAP